MTSVTDLTVGVIGGTGPQGKGLALRWSAAGIRVAIGSRDAVRRGFTTDTCSTPTSFRPSAIKR